MMQRNILKHFETLNDVTDYLKTTTIFNHKLKYICNCFCPSYLHKYSRDIDICNKNNFEIINEKGHRSLTSSRLSVFCFGFDSGYYLNIIFSNRGFTEIAIWTTKDFNDRYHSECDNWFLLDKYFADFVELRLEDIKIYPDHFVDFTNLSELEYLSNENVESWDCGDLYDNGDVVFNGLFNLVFENGKSLLFQCLSNNPCPVIESYTNGMPDRCNFWHTVKCNNIKNTSDYIYKYNEVNKYLNKKLGCRYTKEIKDKVDHLSYKQIHETYYELVVGKWHDNETLNNNIECICCYSEDYGDKYYGDKQLPIYAKYISSLLNNRQVINEDFILANINTLDEMFDILDYIVDQNAYTHAEDVKLFIKSMTQV